MAFPREQAITGVKIGDIAIELFDPNPEGEEVQKASVSVQVYMSNGAIEVRHYDLAEHFPASTINQLKTLAATIRTKAGAEILPIP